jgi:hypothetical protein
MNMNISKGIKLALATAAVLLVGTSAQAASFHVGGVAGCEGCHTMHNSQNGSAMSNTLPQYQSGPYLLRTADQSTICLNCHQQGGATGPNGFYISTADADMPSGSPPLQLTPGGDFGWLKKNYTWTPRAGSPAETSKGESHGHNIISAGYGYVQDSTKTVAPGGGSPGITDYPASKLHCSSCHDPHGKYRLNSNNGTFTTSGKPIYDTSSYGSLPTATGAVGSYRLLAGAGYQPKSVTGSNAFTFPPPIAVAPVNYNKAETDNGAGQTIVAYGKNMSLWCANCHAQMHTTFGTVIHPADQAISSASDVLNIYNTYKRTGDLSGNSSNAYWSIVPTQRDNFFDINTLKNTYMTATKGATSAIDRVMCLSCHRAHASGFDSMMRFGLGNDFITLADASMQPVWPDPVANPAQAQGRTAAETQQSYYGRPASTFSIYQRVLCNKCHAKD